MKKINLIGQRFTRLIVLEEASSNSRGSSWKCLCDCGNEKIAQTRKLRGGNIKSCGCLNQELRLLRIPDMCKAKTKYSPREASAQRVWSKNRYNDGDISFEQFYELSQKNCYYCGAEPSNLANEAKNNKKSSEHAKINGDFIYNGLDRIDSSKPHMLDNVVSCCKQCNTAKLNYSLDDFYNWIDRIYKKKNEIK